MTVTGLIYGRALILIWRLIYRSSLILIRFVVTAITSASLNQSKAQAYRPPKARGAGGGGVAAMLRKMRESSDRAPATAMVESNSTEETTKKVEDWSLLTEEERKKKERNQKRRERKFKKAQENKERLAKGLEPLPKPAPTEAKVHDHHGHHQTQSPSLSPSPFLSPPLSPSPMLAQKKKPKKKPATPLKENSTSNDKKEGSAASGAAGVSSEVADQKKIKSLTKKLRQIMALKKRLDDGEELDDDQMDKIAKEDKLRRELFALGSVFDEE